MAPGQTLGPAGLLRSPVRVLTLRRGWPRMGGKRKCGSRLGCQEFQTIMPREPGAGELKSPRHCVLQMTERDPGIRGETSAIVARPAPVTSGSHAHKKLVRGTVLFSLIHLFKNIC